MTSQIKHVLDCWQGWCELESEPGRRGTGEGTGLQVHTRSSSAVVLAGPGRAEDVGSYSPPGTSTLPWRPSIKCFDPSVGVGVSLSRRAAFEPPPRLRVAPGVRLQRQSTGLRITGAVGCSPAALLTASDTAYRAAGGEFPGRRRQWWRLSC